MSLSEPAWAGNGLAHSLMYDRSYDSVYLDLASLLHMSVLRARDIFVPIKETLSSNEDPISKAKLYLIPRVISILFLTSDMLVSRLESSQDSH